jgi:anti-sigma regulatory factor (Ser/Thr protein kinase)
MATRDAILKIAAGRKTFKTSDVLTALHRGVSRQFVHRTIRELVAVGALVRAGATRGATYALPEHAAELGLVIQQRLTNRALREDEVFDALRAKAPFLRRLPDNVARIFAYAFQEMLNNAIEHSASPTIDVEVRKIGEQLQFTVSDVGVGVFSNIMDKRSLTSELDAIEALLKGKTTTQPAQHSGEGIFFTSRVGDLFILDSHSHRLRFDNRIEDVFVEPLKPHKRGTRVVFSVSAASQRRLDQVFKQFQVGNAEPGFDRSEVKVKLYTAGTTYLSRSQARRILTGLERFRSVTLDFDHVPAIGQAFADEIFRVYRAAHPEVAVVAVNMNETVRFMVERARRSAVD